MRLWYFSSLVNPFFKRQISLSRRNMSSECEIKLVLDNKVLPKNVLWVLVRVAVPIVGAC